MPIKSYSSLTIHRAVAAEIRPQEISGTKWLRMTVEIEGGHMYEIDFATLDHALFDAWPALKYRKPPKEQDD